MDHQQQDDQEQDYFQDAYSDNLPSPAPSESSLIFERNVEDPYTQTYTNPSHCQLCVPSATSRSASSASLSQQLQNSPTGCKHSNHHNLENLVAPALDASAALVTEKDTNLDNVEMIYSRRPSTIGLDMALGRTRTNSHSNLPELSRATTASASTTMGSVSERPRVLRYYSYADMLSDENSNPRRPSITQSLSSTLLRQSPPIQRSNSMVQPSFSNPFIITTNSPHRRDSNSSNIMPPLTAPPCKRYSNAFLSRSPTNQSQRFPNSPRLTAQTTAISKKKNSKFHIESSSGSECSTSDDESDCEMTHSPNSPSLLPAPSSALYTNSTPVANGLRLSRTSTQGSFKKLPPPYKSRTYSNASSINPFMNLSRGSVSSANTQNMDDLLYEEGLQTGSVGEILRNKLTNTSDI